jgi:S-formylglutathione hydrolase FrmB
MTAATLRARAPRPTIEEGAFRSRALRGTIHYAVALPPGYGTSGRRYPVVYFLHGLPAGPNAYEAIGGPAATLAVNHLQAILVGPQGARAGDADPEWHDWGPGRNWETATAKELVTRIDGRFRTIAKRSARATSASRPGATARR